MKFVFIFAFALFAKLAMVESIRGGSDAAIADFNYAVRFTFKWKFDGKNERSINCAGALIKLNAFMTTAKCSRQKDLTKISVYIGVVDYTGTPVSPTKIVIYPDYDQSTLLHNIAIQIIPAQTAGANIGLVILSVPGTAYNGEDATQSGCGRTKIDEIEKTPLQTSINKVIYNTECNINVMQYPTPSTSAMPAKTQARVWDLCTAFPPTNGKDQCLGEEGSALIIKSGTDNMCVGIFSFIAGTGNCLDTEPSVYVRISRYVIWIFSITDANP